MLLDLEIQRDGRDVKVIGLPEGYWLQAADIDEPVCDLRLVFNRKCVDARAFVRQWMVDPHVRLSVGDVVIDGIATSIGDTSGLSGDFITLYVVGT